MKAAELRALISLLDDSDAEIFRNVREKLVSIGPSVIPDLESVWERTFDTTLQQRIEDIIHRIQIDDTTDKLVNWIHRGAENLLEGIILVARCQYPDIEEDKIYQFMDRLKKDIWMEINHSQTALEKCRVFNQVFYNIYGFMANTGNYQAPENNYINKVIESKKGNAVSLAAIYAIIAQELKLPVFGVNLPEHFILCWVDDSEIGRLLSGGKGPNVLFYINPLNRGAIFSRREIDQFLIRGGIKPHVSYYEPAPNYAIIIRMLTNIIAHYQNEGRQEKAEELLALKSILLSETDKMIEKKREDEM